MRILNVANKYNLLICLAKITPLNAKSWPKNALKSIVMLLKMSPKSFRATFRSKQPNKVAYVSPACSFRVCSLARCKERTSVHWMYLYTFTGLISCTLFGGVFRIIAINPSIESIAACAIKCAFRDLLDCKYLGVYFLRRIRYEIALLCHENRFICI